MAYGNHLIDRCTIFRYGEYDDDGVTRHEERAIYTDVHCRLVSKSSRGVDEKGRTKLITTYTLLLLRSQDVMPGDLVQVNEELHNEEPVMYKAGKPAKPNRHHKRVPLETEVEL